MVGLYLLINIKKYIFPILRGTEYKLNSVFFLTKRAVKFKIQSCLERSPSSVFHSYAQTVIIIVMLNRNSSSSSLGNGRVAKSKKRRNFFMLLLFFLISKNEEVYLFIFI